MLMHSGTRNHTFGDQRSREHCNSYIKNRVIVTMRPFVSITVSNHSKSKMHIPTPTIHNTYDDFCEHRPCVRRVLNGTFIGRPIEPRDRLSKSNEVSRAPTSILLCRKRTSSALLNSDVIVQSHRGRAKAALLSIDHKELSRFI